MRTVLLCDRVSTGKEACEVVFQRTRRLQPGSTAGVCTPGRQVHRQSSHVPAFPVVRRLRPSAASDHVLCDGKDLHLDGSGTHASKRPIGRGRGRSFMRGVRCPSDVENTTRETEPARNLTGRDDTVPGTNSPNATWGAPRSSRTLESPSCPALIPSSYRVDALASCWASTAPWRIPVEPAARHVEDRWPAER